MGIFDKLPDTAGKDVLQPVIFTWESRISFGKFKGKKLQWLLDNEPEYLDWLLGLKDIKDQDLMKFLIANQDEIHNAIPDEEENIDTLLSNYIDEDSDN